MNILKRIVFALAACALIPAPATGHLWHDAIEDLAPAEIEAVIATLGTAVDAAGNTASGSFDVTVEDLEPPVINVSPLPVTEWPPNHQYVTLAAADLAGSVTDNCSDLSPADLVITKAVSNEPDNDIGVGDGNTFGDIVISPGGGSVQLRAERQGTGSGRIYTVTLEVTDDWGNQGEATVEIKVPHSK